MSGRERCAPTVYIAHVHHAQYTPPWPAEIGPLPPRDRSTSAPRSVRFRLEIGPLPARDRSTSASRSVRFRLEIGPLPRRDRPTSAPRSAHLHLEIGRSPPLSTNRRPPPRPTTQSSKSTQDRDPTRPRTSAPSARTNKKPSGKYVTISQFSTIQPIQLPYRPAAPLTRSPTVPNDVRREVLDSAPAAPSQPNSGRKRTDLEAEYDRSRRDDQSNLTEHQPSPLYGDVIH